MVQTSCHDCVTRFSYMHFGSFCEELPLLQQRQQQQQTKSSIVSCYMPSRSRTSSSSQERRGTISFSEDGLGRRLAFVVSRRRKVRRRFVIASRRRLRMATRASSTVGACTTSFSSSYGLTLYRPSTAPPDGGHRRTDYSVRGAPSVARRRAVIPVSRVVACRCRTSPRALLLAGGRVFADA